MNWFDIIVITLLLRTSYIGFKNGLSTEIYKALNLIISGLTASYFYKKLAGLANQYIATAVIAENYLKTISFLAIFLICLGILKLFFAFVKRTVQLSFMKGLDATAGTIFGIIRGVLISCLLFVILNWITADYMWESSMQRKSLSGSYIIRVNDQIKNIVLKILPHANR